MLKTDAHSAADRGISAPLAKHVTEFGKTQQEHFRKRKYLSSCSQGPRGSRSTITTGAPVWAPLLKRAKVMGTFHMLRHFFVTALIQSGVNAKVAQTLAGHHSAAFTLDQYADAVPQQLEEAGEKVSTLLLEASGSILVAEAKQLEVRTAQVIELESAPGEIRTPDPQVRSLMLYPTELRARRADSTANPGT
jgi:hypothetical protein